MFLSSLSKQKREQQNLLCIVVQGDEYHCLLKCKQNLLNHKGLVFVTWCHMGPEYLQSQNKDCLSVDVLHYFSGQ